MAVIDCLPGVQVEILVDDNPLKEYEDSLHEEERRTLTRYVEAKSGQKFAVFMKVLPQYKFKGNALSFHIKIDGQYVWGRLSMPGVTGLRTLISKGPDNDAGSSAFHYCFAGVEMVGDSYEKQDKSAKLKDLGCIAVTCFHVNAGSPSKQQKVQLDVSGLGTISEKAVKGQTITHSIGYVPGGEAQPVTRWEIKAVPEEPYPAATFVFRYRSIDALKSMLIIPRTPTPPPLEERDFTTLNHDELKELQKRMAELKKQQESQPRIKREKLEDDTNARPRKIAHPSAGDTQLELDDSGRFREGSTASLPPAEKVVIEID